MSNTLDVNNKILEGKWNQLKGKVRQKWGDLTEDDLERVAGKRDELVGVLQEKYGHTQEEAEKEVNEFLRNL
jgi:uncharacterized protein YjbJ (UPF0337 family)